MRGDWALLLRYSGWFCVFYMCFNVFPENVFCISS